ncbi:MAG: hypothetical protein PWP04_1460 [Candidatus Atribacteria bacterium]|nr:hypothetical protein [Candidatus Atribacteria bacterium]
MKKINRGQSGEHQRERKRLEGSPGQWYLVHELLSPPLSVRTHPYLKQSRLKEWGDFRSN